MPGSQAPSLGLRNCDQKSVAGTLPATDFWRGKLRPETRRRTIAGRRSHDHRYPSGRTKSNTYCRPSLRLGNGDQKSVAGTLPATEFWRGKLRPETRCCPIAGQRCHGHKGGRAKQNQTPTVGPLWSSEILTEPNPGGSRRLRPEIRCWDAPSDGFLEGKVASRNTGAPYSRPALSWAQGGPAQAQFKHLLSALSGSEIQP